MNSSSWRIQLLLTACCSCLLLANAGEGGSTVYIAAGQGKDQFLRALRDPSVTKIVFTTDYDVGTQFDPWSGPYREGVPIIGVDRNITLTGLPGQDPLLDLGFKIQVIELCATCTFTILNMSIANERRGANAQLDFFLGRDSCVLNLTNVVRKRLSCTSIVPAMQLVRTTSRAPRFPGPANGTQIFSADDIMFRGHLYPDTLHLLNYSVWFPRHYNGGYSLVLNNVYRLCTHFVDDACLSSKEADICVSEDIDQLLSGAPSAGDPKALSPAQAAGIAVGAVAGAAMLAALLFLLLNRQRQHWQQDQPAKQLQSRSSWSSVGPRPPPDSSCDDIEPGGSFQAAADGSATGGGGGGGQLLVCPGAAHDDQAAAGEAELHFGALLGAGAFGRVYKARWGDKDVAVKVIEHEPKMTPIVENEVQLMMSCSHENVVRAYHYITQCTPKLQPCPGSTAAAAAAASSGRTPCSNQGSGAHSGQLLQRGSSGGGSGGSGSGLPGHLPPPAAAAAPRAPTASGGSAEARPRPLPPAGSLASTTAVQQLLGLDQPGRPAAALTATAGGGGSSAPEQHRLHTSAGGAGSGGSAGYWSHSAGAASTGLAPGGSGGSASMLSQGFWPQGPVVSGGEDLADMAPDWEAPLPKTLLIQEYCDAGTLSKVSSAWLPANEGDAQMLRRLVLLRDVAAGLAYLHSRSIVHGDLNARNVLITSNPAVTYGYTAKLADLGLLRTIKHHATHHTTCTVGTLSHMPAELLRSGRMSPAVDVYSLGVMMWELFTGEIAFKELHYGQFFETVVLRDLRPPPPPNMPEDYRLLMERCWSKDSALRPSASTILQCIDLMISDRQSSLGLLLGASAKARIPSSSAAVLPAATAAGSAGDAAFVMNTRSCVRAAVCSNSGSDSSKIGVAVAPGLSGSAGSPRCRTLPEQQQQQQQQQRCGPPHQLVRGADGAPACSEQQHSTDAARQPGTPSKDAQQQQSPDRPVPSSRWIEDL